MHNGVDYECPVGALILNLHKGIVTKLGYPYKNDFEYRYVEVTDGAGRKHRYFYIEPVVTLDKEVSVGSTLGVMQDVAARYPGQDMKNHVHYEVIGAHGNYVDPNQI